MQTAQFMFDNSEEIFTPPVASNQEMFMNMEEAVRPKQAARASRSM